LLLKPLGIEQEKLAEASLFASAGAVSKIEALLSAEGVLGKQNVAGIFPGGTPKGNLAPLGRDGIASLADMLAESSSAIPAFVGSAAETQQSAAIIDLMRNKERALDFSGKFNTDEMVAFCKACRVFFSNDWESLQLASGAGALAVSLAGKTAEEALEEAKGQLR
jgi:ADP-heptose:LPS heptosyltransferase